MIVYRQEDLTSEYTPLCEAVGLDSKKGFNVEKTTNVNIPTTCRVLELATDADFEWYQRFGSNSNNQILGIINQFEGLYQSDFNLRIAVVFQNVFTTSADPYTVTGASNGVPALTEVQQEWQTNRSSIQRDAVHLFTARNFTTTGVGELRGANYTGVICSNPNLSCGFSVDGGYIVANTTAHEIGHGFGAMHPAEDGDPEASQCSTPTASVMCSGDKQFPPYFSVKQRDRVINHINSNEGCLLNFNNLSITGSALLCTSANYSSTSPANFVPTWTSSPNISLNTTSGNTVTASKLYDGTGWIQVQYNIGCAVTLRQPVYVGLPRLELSGPETICTNQFYQVGVVNSNSMDQATYNWSTNSSNLYTTPHGSTVDIGSCCAGNYSLFVTAQNSCGANSNSLSINAVQCFSRYTVYPNPATEYVTVEFEEIDKAEALPDEITLMSENSTKAIRKVNPQSEYQNNKLIDGKSIAFNVKDLPRGIYYLHIKNSRRQDKPLDRIRILLE